MNGSEEIKRVAGLARLRVEDAKVERFSEQLGRIIEYVNMLEELDLSDVEPTMHATGSANVFRDDEHRGGLDRTNALASAPEHDGERIRVPRTF